MLIFRNCKTHEYDNIKKLLIQEGIEDLDLSGIVYVVLNENDLIGVGKAKLFNDGYIIDYLVIKENMRNQQLGDGLLRSILNKILNQRINKIYAKADNTYLIKKGFRINTDNLLELNISDFFNKGCSSCGGCNEL